MQTCQIVTWYTRGHGKALFGNAYRSLSLRPEGATRKLGRVIEPGYETERN
jgi:hypothetical protein